VRSLSLELRTGRERFVGEGHRVYRGGTASVGEFGGSAKVSS
jgi:hypothetical protein